MNSIYLIDRTHLYTCSLGYAHVTITYVHMSTIFSLLQVSAIFLVLDNLLLDDNMESFEILEDMGAGQRLLDNVERYALYVAQVLQNDGGNFVANRTGENIGQSSY